MLCALANTAQGIAFNLFLHLPGFLNEIGASDIVIGMIFGATGVTAIAVRPPIGRAMDLRGRRRIILAGGWLNVVAVGGYLAVDAIGPLIVAIRILHGIAEGMLFTSLFTYGADCVPPERRTQGLALFGVSGMLPIAIGASLGEWVLGVADYPGLFVTSFVFAALSLALSLPLRDRPITPQEGEEAETRGFRAALGQRDLLPLWWIATVFAIALASVFTFLKRFVDDSGLGSVSGFFTAYTAIALVLRVGFGWLPDRVGPLRVLVPALVSLAVAFGLLATARSGVDVTLAGLFFGIGHGYTFPILFGLVVTRARDADRGSAMGIFTALFDVGVVLGGPLFGALITGFGFPVMFQAAAAIVALGTAVFLYWDLRTRRVPPGVAM